MYALYSASKLMTIQCKTYYDIEDTYRMLHISVVILDPYLYIKVDIDIRVVIHIPGSPCQLLHILGCDYQ